MHAEWLQILAECGPGMHPSYNVMKDFFAELQAELQFFGKKYDADTPGRASDNWRNCFRAISLAAVRPKY